MPLMMLAVRIKVLVDFGSDNDSNELDDGDFLSQLLRHTKAELLVGSAKGLENFKTLKKSAEENIYEWSKGCPKHWTNLARLSIGYEAHR